MQSLSSSTKMRLGTVRLLSRPSTRRLLQCWLESMILLGKLDAEKRNILDIANMRLRLPLHYTAWHHPDPAAIKLLVLHHPSTLHAQTTDGHTSLDHAILSNESSAVVILMRKLVTAHSLRDLQSLIRLCGPTPTLSHLHSLSLRTAAVLCLERIKTTPVPPPACPTTVAAIELLSEIYDHEMGIVLKIFSYFG